LRGAAYLINGGASYDGFEYLRWWLIGQGQSVFEAVLVNSESLTAVITNDVIWGDTEFECEAVGYVSMKAYKKKPGQEMPFEQSGYLRSEPVGVKWMEEDLDDLFPKIAAKMSSDF
jgi:hypothetical protein